MTTDSREQIIWIAEQIRRSNDTFGDFSVALYHAARKPLVEDRNRLIASKDTLHKENAARTEENRILRQQLASANARISELEAQGEQGAICEWVKADGANYIKQKWVDDYVAKLGDKLYLHAQQAVPKWRPIETLPEGERFLSVTRLSNGAFGQVGVSHSFYSHIVNNRGWKIAGDDPHATHWMPLPAAPSPEGK